MIANASPTAAATAAGSPPSPTAGWAFASADLSVVMPLWFVLQHLGQTNIAAGIGKSLETVQRLFPPEPRWLCGVTDPCARVCVCVRWRWQTSKLAKALAESPAMHVLPRSFDGQYALWRFEPPAGVEPSDDVLQGVDGNAAVAVNIVTIKVGKRVFCIVLCDHSTCALPFATDLRDGQSRGASAGRRSGAAGWRRVHAHAPVQLDGGVAQA